MDLKNSGEDIFSKDNLTGKLFRVIIQTLMNFQDYRKWSFYYIGKKFTNKMQIRFFVN